MPSVQFFDVTREIYWGILLAFYLFYKGMSAGAFLLSSLGTVFGIERYRKLSKVGAILSLVLLVFAPLFLLIELRQPGRFLSLFYRINITSPISWGVYLLVLYAVALLIYTWYLFRQDMAANLTGTGSKSGFYKFILFGKEDLSAKAKEDDEKQIKFFGAIAVVLALAVDVYTGFLLGVVPARALWNSSLLPVILLISAFVSGAALLIFVQVLVDKFKFGKVQDDIKSLLSSTANLLKWFILSDGVLLVIYLIILSLSGKVGAAATYFLLFDETWSFLGLEIGLGLLVPFLILLTKKTRQSLNSVVLASILAIVGVLAMRINLVIGAQKIPLTGSRLLEYTASGRDLAAVIILSLVMIVVLVVLFAILPMNRTDKKETNVGTLLKSNTKGVAQ